MVSPAKSKRFFCQEIRYSAPPTYEFSIFRDEPMPENMQRDVLMWLDSRNTFKEFIVHQPEYAEYSYKCIFTVSNMIYHMGRCIGFTLKANFDSLYQYGVPVVKEIKGAGEVIQIIINNPSDNIDEYVYPIVEFTTNDGEISIINKTDDEARVFKFINLDPKEKYKVDNELKIIDGKGTNLLSKFKDRKWLRLIRGKNQLEIKLDGEAKIICPHYARIRF